MILDTIARSAGKRVEQRKQVKPLEQVMKEAFKCREREGIKREDIKGEDGTGGGYSFKAALSKPGVSFICEVKKASPSKGLIAPDFPYVEIARQYQEAGADAVSVLTEIGLPLLRKDFTVDEYQIYEAKVLGASAVLLICSLLDMEQLKRYMGICGRLGLSSLVEAHTDREVAMAAEAGADIIGINNRNLGTFEVDFTNALRLRKLVDRGTIFVAESGIRTPEDIELLAENQVDAVLVGETLMRAADKKQALRELKSRIR